jgi:hypothetical protein
VEAVLEPVCDYLNEDKYFKMRADRILLIERIGVAPVGDCLFTSTFECPGREFCSMAK